MGWTRALSVGSEPKLLWGGLVHYQGLKKDCKGLDWRGVPKDMEEEEEGGE